MQNNLKIQNELWKNERKANFRESLLTASPLDYQERNEFYHTLAQLVSYPLQFASVLAGAYLLYDLSTAFFRFPAYSTEAIFLFLACFVFFTGIEVLRRVLIASVGYHYFTTMQRSTAGEWLQTKILVLSGISILLVSSGTYGAYQYSRHNAPQAEKIDLKTVASPLNASISAEKQRISETDKALLALQNNKSNELKDDKSYALWAGKLYLLPETKIRHAGYDTQIAKLQTQREAHMKMLSTYEGKLDKTEQKTETSNAVIAQDNDLQKNAYSLICAVIWLCFEALLLFCTAYEWIFKTAAKKVFLFEQPLQQSLQQPLQQPLAYQQPLQRFFNQDLQEAYLALAREKQEKQDALARKKQEKQDRLARESQGAGFQAPNFQGLVSALQQGEAATNVLTNAFHVNPNHVNSAKVLLGLYVKEPEKLLNTSEYVSLAKYLNIPTVAKKQPLVSTDLFWKGGSSC